MQTHLGVDTLFSMIRVALLCIRIGREGRDLTQRELYALMLDR